MKELIIFFPKADSVVVRLGSQSTRQLAFTNPLSARHLDDIRWYLEVYGTQYTTDMDDTRAESIAGQLGSWGQDLFDAVFQNSEAHRYFWNFYDRLGDDPGLITIDTHVPAVLSLPWELLCLNGRHLVHELPHISIRRRLTGAGGTGRQFTPSSKDTLHLLFVVSRPRDAGFIDPRADAMAVMDALDQNAPGRVTVEFLRPATLDNLTNRLKRLGSEHRNKPLVDILHFDGHGVFDAYGAMIRKAVQSDPAAAIRKTDEDLKPDTGYLLFEDDNGQEALITSETLGNMLTNQQVSLVVLSACQSGAVGAGTISDSDDEQGQGKAMNGVAARLVGSGLPCVIAMRHTVLVETTRRLFGRFYARLGDHFGVGAALDEARQHLYAHPERGERRRGQHNLITLRLQDWFLPTLYQSGDDIPLLTKQDTQPVPTSTATLTGEGGGTLPAPPESGFFGRTSELWDIERNFIAGTRRITVTGFGGQGKTVLAAEAGRWLVRTGMFAKCCFIGFAAYQGMDPISFCTSALSVTLEQNLIDAQAAEKALAAIPTLVILDNLESLRDDSGDRQSALLDTAAAWSRAGQSRLLITTRQHRLAHPEYPEAGQPAHRYLDLTGLKEHDAVAFFTALWGLPPDPAPRIQPPARHGLVELFRRVDFHPLSVSILAYQLKFRTAADLGEHLEKLLAEAPGKGPEKNLRASLNLSLERLSPDMAKWLPGLGVFQGGAMEDLLLQVTGLGRADGDTDLTPDADESTWPSLRRALEIAGLIRVEPLPGLGAAYLKFHPALAPALWEQVAKQEKERLLSRHRAAYYRMSTRLYFQDEKEPHAARAVARRELPNLLFAVKAALRAGDGDAVDFVDKVNKFLGFFGLLQDQDVLNKQTEEVAKPGTRAWFLNRSNQGEALFGAGRYAEAEAVFRNILEILEETDNYNRCVTLGRLGRCLQASGRSKASVAVFQEGLAIAEKLEQSHGVRRLASALHTDLADSLMLMGDYPGSRAAYEAGLAIKKEISDDRGIAVTEGQLGTLAMLEGNLEEAERCFKEALEHFQRLNEPASEATFHHQLGYLYDEAKQYDAAEAAYRESARIEESLGNLAGAANTYTNLAVTMKSAGRPAEAETWYRRALEGYQKTGQKSALALVASNLADLLQADPARLDEARALAEQSLVIKETLDPGAAEIWKTYTTLAEIADKQGRNEAARDYRRLSRKAQDNFKGTQHQVGRILARFKPVIEKVVAACAGDKNARLEVEELFDTFRKANSQIVGAIQAIWTGERDEEKLIEPVGFVDRTIIRAILATLRGEAVFLATNEAQTQAEEPTEDPRHHLALAAALPVLQPEARSQAEPLLEQLRTNGLTALADAIDRLWDGEKDPIILCKDLDQEGQTIIRQALSWIENPDELKRIMGSAGRP